MNGERGEGQKERGEGGKERERESRGLEMGNERVQKDERRR